jgi:hypothetical protein
VLDIGLAWYQIAESLAESTGTGSVKEFCKTLLERAIEAERARRHLAEVESRRGPLEGLAAIASDPDYLAEWRAQTGSVLSTIREPRVVTRPASDSLANSQSAFLGKNDTKEGGDRPPTAVSLASHEVELRTADGLPVPNASERVSDGERGVAEATQTRERRTPLMLDRVQAASATELVARHAGQGGTDSDPSGFLPMLRRGEPVSPEKVTELLTALRQLEVEFRTESTIDRRLSHQLHRLALESQVLMTEAWPGVFDERIVLSIRAVQEAVERVLSGEDIRYYETPQASIAE